MNEWDNQDSDREAVPITFAHRHPSIQHMMQVLAPNINLPTHLFIVAEQFSSLALEMVENLPDSPELTAGLRKLLEAKDCFVRCAVFANDPDANIVWYTDR